MVDKETTVSFSLLGVLIVGLEAIYPSGLEHMLAEAETPDHICKNWSQA